MHFAQMLKIILKYSSFPDISLLENYRAHPPDCASDIFVIYLQIMFNLDYSTHGSRGYSEFLYQIQKLVVQKTTELPINCTELKLYWTMKGPRSIHNINMLLLLSLEHEGHNFTTQQKLWPNVTKENSSEGQNVDGPYDLYFQTQFKVFLETIQ